MVHETYRLGIDSESRFHLWSAAKSFTSTVLGRALHEGVIDSLDRPVDHFVKVSGTGYGGATLRHVLRMSSGVNFFHFKGSPDRMEMYRQIWGGDRDLDDFAGELDGRVPPGTDFNYLATDTHILSRGLRAVYDQPFQQIVQQYPAFCHVLRTWHPLRVTGLSSWRARMTPFSSPVSSSAYLGTSFMPIGERPGSSRMYVGSIGAYQ